MPISSSSLFHFTSKEMDGVKSILTSGFEVSFCGEVERHFDGKERNVISSKAIPMVCFCDIPISLAGAHAKIYCSRENKVFGIGMKPSWGVKNGLNPVIYISHGSYLALLFGSLNELLNRDQSNEFDLNYLIYTKSTQLNEIGVMPHLIDIKNSFGNDIDRANKVDALYNFGTFTLQHKLSRLQMYLKPTSGDYFRRGSWIERYSFYNEREWRYIPPLLPQIICSEEPFYLDKNSEEIIGQLGYNPEELGEMCKSFYEQSLKPDIPYKFLTFEHDDISFIIVDSQESVKDLIDFLLNDKFRLGGSEVLTYEKRISLVSKLISWEEITSDILGN